NFTNFRQVSGKENGDLPAENEKSGNKTRSASTQSFTFIINEEEKCKDKTPFLVLLIATRAVEIQHRDAIRKSWGSESAVPGVDVVRLFMLGIESRAADEDLLLRESEQYRDIIQQDFLDTYNNLTLKTLMGMKWVASYCSGTRFAMKTDTDVFVNTVHLVEKLLRPLLPPTQNYFTGCLMKGHRPIRNKDSKWYISEEEFPDNQYHPFCSGTGYVFSGDLAAKIVSASLMVKYIHLEDVFVGFCLNAKGVEIVPPPSYSLFNIYKVPFSPCGYNNIITSHHIQPDEHIHYWQTLQEKKHTC
ncbi:B3GT2 galactosyltransferase, partial [Atrichornis clamosus]|nr:B3GT2 galactosyltransferase [Atrichornis clamosus]